MRPLVASVVVHLAGFHFSVITAVITAVTGMGLVCRIFSGEVHPLGSPMRHRGHLYSPYIPRYPGCDKTIRGVFAVANGYGAVNLRRPSSPLWERLRRRAGLRRPERWLSPPSFLIISFMRGRFFSMQKSHVLY